MNITTRTTRVSNIQLDDNIRIWLLEEEGFKSAPETWKCRRRNNVFGQSIPDPRSRNVSPTTDCRQSERRHHQATGAGRAEFPPTVQICYSVEWSKVPWRCIVQNLVRHYITYITFILHNLGCVIWNYLVTYLSAYVILNLLNEFRRFLKTHLFAEDSGA